MDLFIVYEQLKEDWEYKFKVHKYPVVLCATVYESCFLCCNQCLFCSNQVLELYCSEERE